MAMRTRVQILLNTNERESFFRGYAPGDPLMRVYDGERPIPYREYLTEGLEYIFSANQHVSETHRPWYREGRSISTGDVICLGDKAYAVDRVGFTEIKGFEVPA